jgi:hypothetical protein
MMVIFTGGDGFGQRVSQGAGALRRGKEYRVLEIFSQSDGANKFRIEFSDIELPSLFDSRLFEISSHRIPRYWRVMGNENGSLTFGPKEWNKSGFWEAFMDHEDWAVRLYEAGRDRSDHRDLE